MKASKVIEQSKAYREPDAIDQVLSTGGYAIFGAERDAGKTNEALHLMYSFASAKNGGFHGLAVTPCHALYINFEDNEYKIGDRLEIIRKQYGEIVYEPELLFEASLYLDTKEGQRQLRKLIHDYRTNGYDVKVVILDSLKFTCGGNYLLSNKALNWVKAIKALAKELGICFILMHHTRKLVYNQGHTEDLYSADRLKGAGELIDHSDCTLLYAVDNKVIKEGGKTHREKSETLVPIRHRNAIVDLKACPLTLEFDRDKLCWNGQHWQVDGKEVSIVEGGI